MAAWQQDFRYMLKNLRNPSETASAMLSLLPTSGTMAGISIGLMGVLNLGKTPDASTIADDMLLLSALGFLLVCYLIFFELRRAHAGLGPRWTTGIDLVFLLSLTLMVFSGFVILYEFI